MTSIAINKLTDVMLTKKNIQHFRTSFKKECEKNNFEKIIEAKVDNKFNTNEIIEKVIEVKQIINVNDMKHPIFWLLYICKYGSEQFNSISERDIFKIETTERFNIIDDLNNNISEVKSMCFQHKIKYSNLILNLGNDEDLDLKTFKGLCIYFKINVNFYKLCFREKIFMNDETGVSNIVIKKEGYKTNYYLEQEIEKIIDEEDKYIDVTNIQIPMKSVGTYKLDQLQHIAKMLGTTIHKDKGLSTSKKKNKKKGDLYQEIMEKLY
jgi:hypothetical protein